MLFMILAPLALIASSFVLVEDVKSRRHSAKKIGMKLDLQQKALLKRVGKGGKK